MPNYSITVDLSDHRLYLIDGDLVVKSYPVGIGKLATQTPHGEFIIVNKQNNPGGPYGAFWLGLSEPHYGIHGTNAPWSIGKSVSQGCIRMYNQDVLELAGMVGVGTPVKIRP
ncbi:L,D-transpeptidase [Paenibacillus sp. P96]|uniref:L,D-transpeptidase n=1 Tax=Paenibacillus zeirhizosphaerae TaxID=2987519 RepID=A0ABT9FRT2_9BACL|nr:L,D-transpeptidase [Paenibacillus sp. P96]MDP4097433.1 L,D-transpeptidase [Paenibacillus sp. P96]